MRVLIDADAEITWPIPLLRGLDRLQEGMFAYHVERRRIDKAAENDVRLRIDRPKNPHQLAWTDAVQLANECTSEHSLLGFHATRLTSDEQRAVGRNGLTPLSADLFEARLSALRSVGVITDEQFALLSSCNQVEDGGRSGKTWFCFSRAMLREEWGVSRFFRSWGGEALYNSHEDDVETGPLLRTIGAPCIVVAAVPVRAVWSFLSVGNRLLNVWVSRREIATGHVPEFEGYTGSATPADSVLRIVAHDEAEFLALTAHDRWPKPII